MFYTEAHQLAQSMLKAGEIRSFACGYNSEHGRYIEVQTDQGWCPYPFWQENEQPEDPARYN